MGSYICAELYHVPYQNPPEAIKLIRQSSNELSVSGVHLEDKKYWVLITSSFTHSGFGHIFGNMVMLIAIAPQLEQQVGSLTYGLLYLFCGLIGYSRSILQWKYDGTDDDDEDVYLWENAHKVILLLMLLLMMMMMKMMMVMKITS